MADRSGDQYKKWSEHRILAGILTILQDWFGQISLPSLVDFGLRANDPFLTIAHGSNPLLSQVSHINKFGANKDSGSGVIEDVWNEGGTYSWPTVASITHLSQLTDQVATDGGATIEIDGLDLARNRIMQTVDLDGVDTTTEVALGTPLWRVFRMKVLENIVAADDISVHSAGRATLYATITAGDNQTLMALFTVPTGVTGYLTNYYGDYVRDAVKDPDSVAFSLWAADRDNIYEFQIKHDKGIPKQAPGFQHAFKPYMRITQESDIRISASPSGADAHVHAGFDIILVDD